MPIAPGSRLGSYEIVDWIGAGGMGEVYRARDTRLQRDVAIKLLSDAFASDPGRLARFEREASARRRACRPSNGGWAHWNPKGGEMFYLAPNDELVAVPVTMQSGGIQIGTPTRLFAATSRPGTRLDAFPYDVAPDGRRFLVNTIAASPGPDTLTLVINWQARSR